MVVMRIATFAVAALLLVRQPAAPADLSAHVVVAILHDGKLDRTAGLRIEVIPAVPHHAGLAVGDAIPDGTRIRVPARVTLRIAAHGDTIELAPGADLRVIATGAGVAAALEAGRASFTVTPHLLDFFRVTFRQFTASVRGTVFGVDSSNRAVTFEVSRGSVNVSRRQQIVIAAAGKEIDNVSDVDVLSAQGRRSVSYPLGTEAYLAKYKTFADAERYYRAKLAAGERARDPELIDASLGALSELYHELGNYHSALSTARKELARARTEHRGADERVAAAELRVAQALADNADLAAAAAATREAETRWLRVDPAGTRAGYAWALTGLAAIAGILGQFDVDRDQNLRALAIFRRSGGPDGDAGATAASEGLAFEAEAAGDFAAAQRYVRAAVADVTRQHAAQTPRGALLERDLARISLELGDYPAAEDHARRSIAVFRRVLGTENSPDVATDYDVLAYAQLFAFQTGRALESERHAAALIRASGHAHDAAGLEIDIGMGFALQLAGRAAEGQRAYEQAFASGSLMAAGTNGVVDRAMLSILVIASTRSGKPAEALAYAQREVAAAQHLVPPSPWYLAAAFTDRASVERQLHQGDAVLADDRAAVAALLPQASTPILLAQAYARLAVDEFAAGALADARADAGRARSIVRTVPGIWPATVTLIDQQTAPAMAPAASTSSPPP